MQIFPSKVDWWLAALLVGVLLVTLGSAVAVTYNLGMAGLPTFATPIFILTLYGVAIWPMRYVVADDELVVRFGLLKKRIKLAEIRRVKPSHNPLSSPALSLDRIRIDYGRRGVVLISPADRAGFAQAIEERVPGVEIDDRLRG